MPRLRAAIERGGPGRALAGLDPSASYRDDPSRVVFDKFHHGIVNVATTRLLVVPSAFGCPHILVKHEPGPVAVIQYPPLTDGAAQPNYTDVHRRLEVLRDPGARAIAREPLTPSEGRPQRHDPPPGLPAPRPAAPGGSGWPSTAPAAARTTN
ncbi:DUF5937 family protein [Streptomyces decoyicus]|uniref:DUF5937 family protein n=1 Tax=Streptomyces decoyicus TaxID=249567 RepID=UPI0033B7CDF0